jgi:hypothetical protein
MPSQDLDEISADEILAELRSREAGGGAPRGDGALADVDSATLAEVLRDKQKVIYGIDDRRDVFEVTDSDLLDDADGVVGLFPAAQVNDNGDGTSTLVTVQFGASHNLCSSERFFDQPLGPNCSGYLVESDVIATAGHCVTASTLSGIRFVFGFRMIDATTPPVTVSNDDVFSGVALLGRQKIDTGPDWALVRLDRPALNHRVVPIRHAGKIGNTQAVHVIGHPVGLPTKIAGGANVRNNSSAGFFVANLDTYGGNSGSPVFNATSHEAEGILVRGETDFTNNGSCVVSLVCPSSGCRGEDVTRATVFAPILDGTTNQTKLLRRGSTGIEVSEWQGQLNQVRSAIIEVDGIFGQNTDAATRDFQRDAGISADGIVGPQSRAAMQAALNP